MTRKITGTESDTHSGNKLGLLYPNTPLYDKDIDGKTRLYHPNLTAVQEYLYELREENISRLTALAGLDEIVYSHMGDMNQGNKHPFACVTSRLADQFTIATHALDPMISLEQVNHARFIAGTQAHNFGQASAEIEVCSRLSAKYPDKDIQVLYHGLIEINGVTHDMAHHGSGPGIRIHLRGDNLRRYLRDLMLQEILAGRKPPDIVLRGHHHQYCVERVTVGEYESIIVLLPSYCMMDDYTDQVAQSPIEIVNGMVAIETVDGKIANVHGWTKKKDVRTKEVL